MAAPCRSIPLPSWTSPKDATWHAGSLTTLFSSLYGVHLTRLQKKEERTDRVRDAMLRHGTTFSRQARMAFTFKRQNFLSGLISSAFPTDTCRMQRLIPNLSGGDGPRQTLSEKMSFGLVSTSICWISSLPLIEVCILSQQKIFQSLDYLVLDFHEMGTVQTSFSFHGLQELTFRCPSVGILRLERLWGGPKCAARLPFGARKKPPVIFFLVKFGSLLPGDGKDYKLLFVGTWLCY